MVYQVSNQTPSSRYPELLSGLCQGLLDPIVVDTLVSSFNNQIGQWVISKQEHGAPDCEWTFHIGQSSPTTPNCSFINKEIKLLLLGLEVRFTCQLSLGTLYPQHLGITQFLSGKGRSDIHSFALEPCSRSHHISGYP